MTINGARSVRRDRAVCPGPCMCGNHADGRPRSGVCDRQRARDRADGRGRTWRSLRRSRRSSTRRSMRPLPMRSAWTSCSAATFELTVARSLHGPRGVIATGSAVSSTLAQRGRRLDFRRPVPKVSRPETQGFSAARRCSSHTQVEHQPGSSGRVAGIASGNGGAACSRTCVFSIQTTRGSSGSGERGLGGVSGTSLLDRDHRAIHITGIGTEHGGTLCGREVIHAAERGVVQDLDRP